MNNDNILKNNENVFLRRALPEDIPSIHKIISFYAEKKILLPRSPDDIKKHLTNFFVAFHRRVFVGCVALRNYGENLFEVRSLAVYPEFRSLGIGSLLVRGCIKYLQDKANIENYTIGLFALTNAADFFSKIGFKKVPKEMFPEKIWTDCRYCPKKDNCDEDSVYLEIRPKKN